MGGRTSIPLSFLGRKMLSLRFCFMVTEAELRVVVEFLKAGAKCHGMHGRCPINNCRFVFSHGT